MRRVVVACARRSADLLVAACPLQSRNSEVPLAVDKQLASGHARGHRARVDHSRQGRVGQRDAAVMTGHPRGAPQSRYGVGDCRRARLHVEHFESGGFRGARAMWRETLVDPLLPFVESLLASPSCLRTAIQAKSNDISGVVRRHQLCTITSQFALFRVVDLHGRRKRDEVGGR